MNRRASLLEHILVAALVAGLVSSGGAGLQRAEAARTPAAGGGTGTTLPGQPGGGHHPGKPKLPPPPPWTSIPGDSVTPSEPLGRLPGELSVTPSGAARYHIPLDVPAGRAGMEPELAFSYESNQSNGIMGRGWRVAGTSQVTRCGHRYSWDGDVDTVQFDNSDNFCLDGTRLVEVALSTLPTFPPSVSPPAAPALKEYRTEQHSNRRVVSFGYGEPSFWVIWEESGRLGFYGDTGSHVAAVRFGTYNYESYAWLLSRTMDRRGNTIRYDYVDDPAVAAAPNRAGKLLSTISYTDFPTSAYGSFATQRRQVRFLYEPREDRIDHWINGFNVHRSQRLSAVEMWVPAPDGAAAPVLARSYHIGYTTSSRSLQSLVSEITLCDGFGSCAPATSFSYAQPEGVAPVAWTTSSFAIPPINWQSAPRLTIFDADGDGNDDLLFDVWSEETLNGNADIIPTKPLLRRSDGSANGGFAGQADLDLSSLFSSGTYFLPSSGRAFDYDGDGFAEWMACRSWQNAYGDCRIYAWDHGAHTFVDTGTSVPGAPNWALPVVTDYNGDGLVEIANGWIGSNFSILERSGSTYVNHPGWNGSLIRSDRESFGLDLDGNGTGDIVHVCGEQGAHLGTCTPGQFWVTRLDRGKGLESWQGPLPQDLRAGVLIDINGDGLKDIVHPLNVIDLNGVAGWCIVPDTSPVIVQLNTGNGFAPGFEAAGISGGPCPEFGEGIRVADFNGDGREDLLIFDEVETDHLQLTADSPPRLWLSTGLSFVEVAMPSLGPRVLDSAAVGDFDNDGTPEIIVMTLEGTGTDCGPECGDGYHYTVATQVLPQPRFYDRLIQVVDGFGAVEQIDYHDFKPPVHAPATGCSYPERCPVGGQPLVHVHRVLQPSMPSREYEYSYAGARKDVLGRGGIGFESVTVLDRITGRTTTVSYDQRRLTSPTGSQVYPFATLPASIVIDQPLAAGPDFRRTVTYRRSVKFSGAVYRVDTSSVDTRDTLGGVTQRRVRTISSGFDAYGKPSLVRTSADGGSMTQVSRSYAHDPVSWLIGRVDLQTTTDTTPSLVTRSFTVDYVHNAFGELVQGVIEPTSVDPDVKLTTTVARDAGGLITAVTRADMNGETRTERVYYTADGVYPLTFENALGHYSHVAYDPRVDAVVLSADANGAITTTSYDGFGRVVKHASPDGSGFKAWYQAGGSQVPLLLSMVPFGTTAVQTVAFDNFGRARGKSWTTFDGGVAHTDTLYDEIGRVRLRLLPQAGSEPFRFVSYHHDELNRVVEIKHPDGASESFDYPDLHTTVATDMVGNKTTQVRNVDGHVVSTKAFSSAVSPPATLTTTWEYGPFGRVSKVIDPAGTHLDVLWDARGRKSAIHDPNAGSTYFKHNAFGELTQQIDGAWHIRIFMPDALGRVVSRISEDGLDSYEYDAAPGAIGRLTRATAASGAILELGYDSIGRVTSERRSIAGESFETNAVYDSYGRIQELHYPVLPDGDRLVTRHHYNFSGYADFVLACPFGGAPCSTSAGTKLYEVLERGSSGEILSERRGEVAEIDYGYDPLTRQLTSVQAQVGATDVLDLAYTHYDDRALKSRDDFIADVHELYSYDEIGRLSWWTVERQGDWEYRKYLFNKTGTLKSVSDYESTSLPPVATMSYTYPGAASPRPHAPIVAGDEYYTYDAIGRRVAQHHWQLGGPGPLEEALSYGSWNLPVEINQLSQITQFAYDAFGERVRKFTATSETLYGGPTYERRSDAGGETHVMRVYGDGLVAQIEWSPATGTAVSKLMLPDGRGSVAVVLDGAGTVLERLHYQPYGGRVDGAGAALPGITPAGVTAGFTGHEHDDAEGFINMGGRVYDPAARVFLSPDPFVPGLERGAGLGRYAYVSHDPVNLVDPTGFQEEPGITWDGDHGYIEPMTIYGSPPGADSEPPELVEPVEPVEAENRSREPAGTNNNQKLSGGSFFKALVDMELATPVDPMSRSRAQEIQSEWGFTPLFVEKTASEELDGLQTTLEMNGMVPGVGEPMDALNALISLGRAIFEDPAHWEAFGWNAAAMAPLLGNLSTLARWSRNYGKLLPGELMVGSYDELIDAGKIGDDITPHHMPSKKHMAQHGVEPGDGVSMNMEHPHPGTGGRHRATATYGTSADLNMSPRDALAFNIRDAKRIYQMDGLYGPEVSAALRRVIEENLRRYPEIFAKPPR